MATKKKSAKSTPAKTKKVVASSKPSAAKKAIPAPAKKKKKKKSEKPAGENTSAAPAASDVTISADETAAATEIKNTEQAASNLSATAPAPVVPAKVEVKKVAAPSSLKEQVEKFGKHIEGIISEHVSRLPMTKAEAINFIKSSNTKCRVEVADEKQEDNSVKQIVTVFLGNESHVFNPITLH